MIETEVHKGGWGSKIFSQGVWYLISSVFTKGLSIILLPIFTNYLSPSEFGILQTLNAVAAFLPVILSLALDSAFGRLFHDYKKNKEHIQILLSTIYWFILGYGIFILILCFTTSGLWFNSLLEIPAYPYIYLSFIPVLLNQLSILGKGFFIASLNIKRVALIDASSSLINGGVSVLLMVIWNLGIIGRLSGMALASIYLFFFYTIFLIKNKYLVFVFSKKILIESFTFSAPLLPFIVSSWIGSLSDRLIISFYGGFEKVGIYSLAYQLATIIYILGDGFTRVTGVLTISGLVVDKERTKVNIANYSIIIWIFMLSCAWGIYLFSKEFVWITAPESYNGAYILVPIITIPYIFGIQARFLTDMLLVHKKTWIITIGIILSAMINLVLNLIFVPIWGAMGAAIATVFSALASYIFYYMKSQKLTKIDFSINKMFKNLILCVLFVLIVFYSGINDTISIRTIILKIVIYFSSLLIVFYINKAILSKLLKSIFANIKLGL